MKKLIFLTLFLLSQTVLIDRLFARAVSDASMANVQLSSPAQEATAMALMQRLRCIQCQGQSIADSDAPIAAAMRSEVRERIQKGETQDAVRNLMVSRYGEWVSFDPPFNANTLLLWLAPFLFLGAGFLLSRGLFKKPKS
jgi:cytochrome c-type biogenesis protein CcmH